MKKLISELDTAVARAMRDMDHNGQTDVSLDAGHIVIRQEKMSNWKFNFRLHRDFSVGKCRVIKVAFVAMTKGGEWTGWSYFGDFILDETNRNISGEITHLNVTAV